MVRAISKLWTTEDWWSVWFGLGIVAAGARDASGPAATIKGWAVTPGEVDAAGRARRRPRQERRRLPGDLPDVRRRLRGLDGDHGRASSGSSSRASSLLFAGSLADLLTSRLEGDGGPQSRGAAAGAPRRPRHLATWCEMPEWFKSALRTEYYIKTGIVLLGATLAPHPDLLGRADRLPAGDDRLGLHLADDLPGRDQVLQARAAVRSDAGRRRRGVRGVGVDRRRRRGARQEGPHLDRHRGRDDLGDRHDPRAHRGAQADSCPAPIAPGVAGAWVGTSEFADAAGFAVVAELATRFGDAPINAFTLMKVIGRDIWIGIWCLILAVVSVVFWEKRGRLEAIGRRRHHLGALSRSS